MLDAHSCWLLGPSMACHSAASHCSEGLCGLGKDTGESSTLDGGGGWGAALGENSPAKKGGVRLVENVLTQETVFCEFSSQVTTAAEASYKFF